ncbi:MAG: hypothetical protein P4L28_02030 [Paludibacteraceae bacterium]|nr:hypothetical protein [Paludibacteraceae bacterium]
MKKLIALFALLTFTTICFSQKKLEWSVSATPFFDNTEFGGSKKEVDQTMAGTRLAPEIGMSFDTVHRVHVGVALLQEFGSANTIDSYHPIAYYEFNQAPFKFTMGAFPRDSAVGDYPRVFFQDSIGYYRPLINGLVWKIYNNNSHMKVWLDWTGRQSTTQREEFFMGWAGKTQKGVVYLQHFGYMMHYAKMKDAPDSQFIHDNGLMLTSIGLDFSKQTVFDKLSIDAGWLLGLERDRGTSNWLRHNDLLIEANIEYKCIGFSDTYFRGDGQMYFYPEENNKLYWGEPIYRNTEYNRIDGYIKFIETDNVKLKFVYTLHAAEHQIFHEQGLYASIYLNNYKKKSGKKQQYLWSKKK